MRPIEDAFVDRTSKQSQIQPKVLIQTTAKHKMIVDTSQNTTGIISLSTFPAKNLTTSSIKDLEQETTSEINISDHEKVYTEIRDDLHIGTKSGVKNKATLNNGIFTGISKREWGILSENINLDILPLEEDPNSQSVKSTNMNRNGNVLEYIEQAVIGVITVIILSIILLAVVIILTTTILRSCIHRQSTSEELELQVAGSPYLIQITDHKPLPYLLPEPELFTSEAYPKQNSPNSNKSHLRDFIRNSVKKCLKTPNQKGILMGRIHIVSENETKAVTSYSNGWKKRKRL